MARHKAERAHRGAGIAAIALGTGLWGTVGPVVELFPTGTTYQYAAMRNVTGTLVLWLLAFATRSRDTQRYSRADILPIAVGGIGVAFFFPLFSEAFHRTGVAVAAVVSIGVAPIFVGIIAALFLGQRPGWKWLLGTVVAVAGVTALNWPGADTAIDAFGVGLALAAALAYSWQATGMGLLTRRHSPFRSVAPVFTVGSVLQAPLAWGKSFDYLKDPVLLLGNLYGGIMTVAVAYALFTYGVRQVGTATAVTVGLTEPLTATIMGVTILGEVIAPLGIAGLVTILVGLIIVSLPSRTYAGLPEEAHP